MDMIYPTFDDDLFKNCVIEWINNNEELFLQKLFKRQRYDRTQKIDYWETSWGEMLQHPHIRISTSKVARYFNDILTCDFFLIFFCLEFFVDAFEFLFQYLKRLYWNVIELMYSTLKVKVELEFLLNSKCLYL